MSDFTQRHYVALAGLMQTAKVRDDKDQQGGLDMLERLLTEMLAKDNPSFRRDLFVAACQPGASLSKGAGRK